MNRLYVCLQGGLGNQLFQYAAARRVAIINNSELLLDLRENHNGHERGMRFRYSLKHFNISARIADISELPAQPNMRIKYFLWRNVLQNPRLIKDIHLACNRDIKSTNRDIYLRGYYQSEYYFADIADALRHEFQTITPPTSHNIAMLNRIKSHNSVSLHIRRGDYITKKWSKHFAYCSNKYYEDAIKYLSERIGSIVIFVFTNDIKWVMNNMKFQHETIISKSNQGDYDYEDLRLMSACKHNIIANSTFSWWGAWLNHHPNKIIVAPTEWFRPGIEVYRDVVPHSWHRINN